MLDIDFFFFFWESVRDLKSASKKEEEDILSMSSGVATMRDASFKKKEIRVPFGTPLFLGKWYGVATYFFYINNKKK